MKKIFLILIISLSFLLIISNKNNNKKIIADINYPTCYQQNDPRWGSHMNGGGSIASSACGLLSLTNSVNYLTGNFINPIEIADYAYSIGAYNIPAGGGTWRDLFYGRLQKFEEKYGFKVVNASIYKDVTDPRLKNHLMTGGVSICHVYGHFIAVVGYDKDTNSYLVYDSAASVSRRKTYARATWLSEAELHDGAYMDIDWFCLISKTRDDERYLDGLEDKMCLNNRVEVSYVLPDSPRKNIMLSGYVNPASGSVISYYYNICPLYSYEYEHFDNYHQLSYYNMEGHNPNHLIGFKDVIDIKELSKGTYYIYFYADTTLGHKINLGEIKLEISNETASVESNNENEINLDLNLNNVPTKFDIHNLNDVSYINVELDKVLTSGSINILNNNNTYLGSIDLSKNKDHNLNVLSIHIGNLDLTDELYICTDIVEDVKVKKITYLNDDYYNVMDDKHQYLLGMNVDEKVFIDDEHSTIIKDVPALCNDSGHRHTWCYECNKDIEYQEYPALGHLSDGDYYYNNEGHFMVCDRCLEEYNNASHQFELMKNNRNHYHKCSVCGYECDFESHTYDENHLCSCGLFDPNYHEEEPTPSTDIVDEPQDDIIIHENPSKRSCKKNTGIYLIQLLTIASMAYLFLRRKN